MALRVRWEVKSQGDLGCLVDFHLPLRVTWKANSQKHMLRYGRHDCAIKHCLRKATYNSSSFILPHSPCVGGALHFTMDELLQSDLESQFAGLFANQVDEVFAKITAREKHSLVRSVKVTWEECTYFAKLEKLALRNKIDTW